MNWINRFRAIIEKNITLVIFLVLVIIVAFYGIHKAQSDFSSTDVLSSIADVSMAFFALLGLLVAKRWKAEATQSKGVDVSISILTESIPMLNGLIIPTVYTKLAERYLLGFKDDNSFPYPKTLSFRNGMKPHGEIVKRESKELSKLRSDLKTINVLSWSVTSKYKSNMDTYINLVTKCINKEIELRTHIVVVLSAWNIDFTDDDSKAYTDLTWDFSDNYNVDEGIKLCNEIVRIKEDLYNHLKIMNVDTVSIFDVFGPKH